MLGAVALLLAAGTARAQANKCTAAKLKCAGKKASGLLNCHSKAETKGTAVDPGCTQKAIDKFGAGPKSCMQKALTKGACVVPGDDTATMEAKVDAAVLDIVTELDPGYPTPAQSTCSAAKKKAAGKKISSKLGCYSKAKTKGVAVDPACLTTAEGKFNTSWGTAESKADCLAPTGDLAAIEGKVDDLVRDVVGELMPMCGDGVLAYNEVCDDGNTTSCTPYPGCNTTCSAVQQCGNGVPGECGEPCDDGDLDDCDGCRSDCTVQACGDGIVDCGEVCDPPGSPFGSGPPLNNGVCDACASPSGAFLDAASL